jgi:hypothetical protein
MKRRKLLSGAAAVAAVAGLPRDARAAIVNPPAPPIPPFVTTAANLAPVYRNLATKCAFANAGAVTGNTNYRGRIRLTAVADIVDPVVVYGNFSGGLLPEVDPVNNGITFRAAIEYPIGTGLTPLWYNGSRDMVLAPGGQGGFDAAGILIPAGSAFYAHTRMIVGTTGETIGPTSTIIQGTTDGYQLDQLTTDNTSTIGATYATTNQNFNIGPLAVLGRLRASVGVPSVLILGDSIAAATGDTNRDYSGFIARGIGATLPFMTLAKSSAQANHWTASRIYSHVAAAAACGATHAISDMGTNDLGAGRTVAQIQADLIAFWTLFTSRRIKVWQTTQTPHTTSTDTWATLGNQTPLAAYSTNNAWATLNDWIRTTPAPLSGYIEVADTVTPSRNTCAWNVGSVYLTDGFGLHPSPAGHAAMAVPVAAAVATFT